MYYLTSNYSGVTVDTGLSYTCIVDGQSRELTAFDLYVLPKFVERNKPGIIPQATQATVSWEKWEEGTDEGEGPVEAYKVYYRKTTDSIWTEHNQNFPVVDPDQTSYSTDIAGLDWSTEYDFTVTVKRPGPRGEGSKNTYSTATTLCDVPEEGPTITDATSDDPHKLQITVTVPEPSKIKCDSNGVIESFRLKYKKAGTQKEYVEISGSDGNARIFEITELVAYTEYEVMVSYFNRDKQSPWSSAEIERTDEDVPTKPQSVTLIPAVYAIEVQWSKPDPTNGIIDKYKIRYWETNNAGGTQQEKEVTEDLKDVNSYLITNLTHKVEYSVQVAASTTPGEGPLSDAVSVETTESIPAMPTSVEVLNSQDDQIELTWTAPFPFRGDITNYGISYTSKESIFEDTQMQSQSTVVQGSIDTYTLEDLSPGTTYEIKVNASTVKGFGEPRSLMSGTTFTVDISEVLPMTDGMNNKIVHSDNQAQVILPQLAEDSGISEDTALLGYVIVLEYDQSSKRRRKRDIDPSRLGEYNETGPPYYITALLPLDNVPETFIIGDNSENGGYRNVPLTTGRQYGVYYGLSSEVNGEPYYSLGDEPALNFRGGGPLPEKGSPVGAIVGAFMAVIIIAALAVGGGFLYRRYRPTKSKDKYREDQLHTPDENPSDDEFKYQNVLFEKSSPGSPKKTDKNEYHYANVDEINTRDKKKNGAPVTESPYATPDDVSPKAYSPLKPAKKPDLSNDGPPKLPQKPVVPPEITAKKPSVPNKPQPSPKPAALNSNSDHVIRVEDLPDYIMKKRQTDDFKKEFKTLPYGQVKSVEDAKIPDNTKKNRFRNILAYDHSRVRLDPIEGEPNSDYINASYIDGYKKEKAYIAAQGPNNLTVDDLWRLVWQQNITIILMATNLSENGKVKCHQYWPEGDNEWYGDIFVTFVGTDSYADYNVRTFQLQMEDSEVRVVKQFHFTVWPDMGVPIYATGVLGMLRHLKSSIPANSGPLLVHCSAGVGRTGTFISIDAMQEMAKAEGKVDIYNFVRKSRENRMNFVQVEDQYEFIHTALMEATLCGNTAISSSDYRQTFTKLQKINRQTGKAPLEEEWENLGKVSRVAREDELSVGTAKENARKNRFPSIVPFNRYRPHLMTQVEDADANDYINASFVSAYVEKDAFLVTQIPLPNTMCDFWRMVYDYNSYSIIALNDMASKDKSVGQYWPEDGALEFGPFTIETVSRDVEGSIIIRTLALSDKRGNVRTIQQFQLTGWPANAPRPKQKGVFVELMGMVEKWQQQTGNGPITVHCINGIGRSGVYCAAVSACERIKVDQMVDIFQAVKTLRSNRPNMIESLDQYKFCYEIILDYFESFDTYANFQ
ncbi:receptor-type tyrosine-protein phosphatase mu-like [Ptychodera flava]|uniref:receptor-type tyrosine-protein phosphatase mu-like n=1 Tax=Ptychodera flava TaxID=63121 RepID=UPI003969F074